MLRLSISKAWDESKAILARDGRLVTAVGLALVGAPLAVANFLTPTIRPGTIPSVGLWVVAVPLAVLVGIAGLLALIRLALGPQISVGEAVAHGLRRLVPALGAILLAIIPLVVLAAIFSALGSQTPSQSQQNAPMAFALLIVVLSPLLSRFTLLPSVATAEDGGPFRILQRSWKIGQGSGLLLFGTFLMIIGAWLILEFAFTAVFGSAILLLVGPPEPQSLSKLLIALAFGLLRMVEAIVLATMLARIYAQLSAGQPSVPEVKREG